MAGILYVVFNESIRNPDTNERLYKIGITKNSISERYYGLGLKMPGKFETLFAYKIDDYAKAEQFIHGILDKKRENGEWFNLNQNELEHIKTTCEFMGGIIVTDEYIVETETITPSKQSTETDNKYLPQDIITNGNLGKNIYKGMDILNMKKGDYIDKKSLYDLIVNSKNKNSDSWAGEDYAINNTPQQGINWIGNYSCPKAVIVKSKEGKYREDIHGETYAFKARNKKVNKNEKANRVIINQKRYKYPIMYFVLKNNRYYLYGRYAVNEVFDKYVTLMPFDSIN
jgi:hypothetical protein